MASGLDWILVCCNLAAFLLEEATIKVHMWVSFFVCVRKCDEEKRLRKSDISHKISKMKI